MYLIINRLFGSYDLIILNDIFFRKSVLIGGGVGCRGLRIGNDVIVDISG